MKRMLLFLIALSMISFVAIAKNSKDEIPDGMQKVEVGSGYNLIIPKDLKVSKVGAQVVMEDTGEYLSRKRVEFEQQLESFKKSLEEQNTRLINLEGELAAAKNEIVKLKLSFEQKFQSQPRLDSALGN
jgi:hypothetical protein